MDNKEKRTDGRNSGNGVGKICALASVLILAGTFTFSVVQYRLQQTETLERQKIEQLIRIKNQIRNDTEGIGQFPKNKNMTISGAEFLLADLDGLLRSETEVDGSKSESAKQERRRITQILYDLVNEDSDFSEHRNVRLSIAIFEYWDDYKEYVKGDDDLISDLLAVKYSDAIEALRKRSNFITAVEYDKGDHSIQPPRTLTVPEDNDLRHFEDLVRGFEKHLRLIDSDWEKKKKLLIRFQAASCNQSLTDNRLGWSIDPKDKSYSEYSEWFLDCP